MHAWDLGDVWIYALYISGGNVTYIYYVDISQAAYSEFPLKDAHS